jgi:hypothetical protein
MRNRIAVICTLSLLLPACREGDGPADPSVTDARIYLASSPNGAQITIDNRNTGQITPDTVSLRRGDRAVQLRLDSAGYRYDFGALIEVERTDSVHVLTLPVGLQCLTETGTCVTGARTQHDAAGIRLAASARGSLFHWGGSGQGIIWPTATTNSFASSGMPLFAGLAHDVPVALGMYDQFMLVGRPVPRVTRNGGAFRLEQETWVLPPLAGAVRPTTVRGLLIEQEVLAHDDVSGVIVVRLNFRNISDDPLVHRFAPHIPTEPVTYSNAYIGFALDPDIGAAGDDWLSYDLDLDMVFAYDADFAESTFGADAGSPALIGMRVLEAPAGTTVLLDSWSSTGDWSAGSLSEVNGYRILTGEASYAPDHQHPQIGHLPPGSREVRMAVSAGPLTLEPGDEALIVIAIALAPPNAGTFSSGTVMSPGDPLDTGRPLYAAAANLRGRMIAAETLPSN